MLQATVVDTQQAVQHISEIAWLQPSWDLFVISFFLLASLIYGFALGRDRIIIMLVAIYMSIAVVRYVPFIQEFNANISLSDSFALRVTVFLGVFILLFFFLSQSALIRTLGASASQGKLLQVIVFSFLQTGLLISVTLSFFPDDVSKWVSPLTANLFLSDIARTAWVILPIVAMVFLGGKKSEE